MGSHRVSSSSRQHAPVWEMPLVAVVLLLGALLRTGWPQLTEFKYDEARMASLALGITREGRFPLAGVPSSAGFDHSPISVYLYAPAFLLTHNPVPATVYSGAVGLLVVALCFRFGRHWPGGSIAGAFASALLAAASPWAVLFCRKIWQVSFVPTLALVFVGLAVSGLVMGKRWSLCGCTAVYAILAQVHPSAISLSPALLLWLVLFWRKEMLVPLTAGVALGACTAIPFVLHQTQSGWSILNSLQGLSSATLDLSAIHLIWQTVTGKGIEALAGVARPQLRVVPAISPIFAVLGWLLTASVAGLGCRAISGWRRPANHEDSRAARIDIILISWVTVIVLANLRHSLDLQLHHFAIALPPAFLIIGRALTAVCSQPLRSDPPRARLRRALGKALKAAIGVLAVTQVACLILMGSFVSRHDTAGGFGRPLGHYLEIADTVVERARDTSAAEVLVAGQGSSPIVDEVPAIFDVLLRQRIAYRFHDNRTSAVFPMYRSIVLITPERGAAASWYGLWPETILADGFRMHTGDGSWPRTGLRPIVGPRLLQNGIELQAFSWTRTETSKLWLLWQVLWETEPDSHFFVHLVDAQARLAGQRDIPGVPSEYRRAGDRVLTLFDITTQGSDTSSLWAQVGMYTYPELAAIPVVDSSGNPVASEVRLGPLEAQPGSGQP